MTRHPPRAIGLLLGFAMVFSTGALADDTEVFVRRSSGADDERANVLFIIDNSGSMDTPVETQADWDPGTAYTGCYRRDALYFATGTEAPPCGSPAFVLKSANRCASSRTPLEAAGVYRGLALGWDAERERWGALAEEQPERVLECEADRGVDGDGPGGETYAANGSEGPWQADPSQEPTWNAAYTLFDGNFLNWQANPPTITLTRLQVVQRVVNSLLDSLDGVNVGLMKFNAENGGAVVQAVKDIATSREEMKTAINALTPFGFTPLSETLYEAALYLRGSAVDFGNVGPQRSVADARQGADPLGATYLTPLRAECQKNFIILLTDGAPTRDFEADAKIRALPGFSTLVGSCDGTGAGACLDDLAEYLLESDASGTLDNRQNVVTYTIGFEADFPLLEATARRGGGEYYLAGDTASLTAVLTNVVASIRANAGQFAALGVPVGAYGQTPRQRDVFVSLFQPSTRTRWPGNLKKYRFAEGQLLGVDGEPAVNPATGFLRSDAQSFWSAEPDGDRVPEGGAASQLPEATSRRMYTDLAGPDLTDSGNRVARDNSDIDSALLGIDPAERGTLIDWILGVDARDADGDGTLNEARLQMGDPLHVRPVTLNYGTLEDPDTVVFVSTNEGLLHAIDADTGEEIWSYLPARQLARQYDLYLDREAANRSYGLDGELRLYRALRDDEARRDVLVFGMGRGGDAVFAVDVTDRDAPVLLWQITSSTSGFAALGQTWSAPEVVRVAIGGEIRTAVVLSGGYDDGQDNAGFRTDNVGNAIFMVDLETGQRLWSAGAPDADHDLELPRMRFSIPAAPRVFDLTGDGLADRLYVGDMGGQLWRFDFINGESAAGFGMGGVLASLGGADLEEPTDADVRRFHATPDVVFVDCDRGTFLSLNIGSGYRGHPLDTSAQDMFFAVRDANVYGAIATEDYPETPLGVEELIDITTDPAAVVPRDAAGWRLRLIEEPGEKVLSPAITFRSTTFFTSFAPGGNASACSGGLGVNRSYQVDACNGRPVNNLDGSTEPPLLGIKDRFRKLPQTGIAAEMVFLSDGSPGGMDICIGTDCFKRPPGPGEGAGTRFPRSYWQQEAGR